MISAALLVGGESRRMGQDKATLTWNGKPLWQKQLEILRVLRPAELLISGRVDPEWRPTDTVFVRDAQPSSGPISGMAAALRRSAATHLIVVAIDMPYMTSDYLSRLCSKVHPGSGVVPMIGNEAEPLAAVYDTGAIPYFDAALVSDDFSARSVVRRLIDDGLMIPLPVKESERPLFYNVNERPGTAEASSWPNE